MVEKKVIEGEVVGSELVQILDEQGVSDESKRQLVEAFGGPFHEVGSILFDYKNIVVTDVSQIKEMSEAREKRLALKKARTTVENKRKELKEDSLKTGRAIDAVARFVKETIEPAEKYLEEQERFKELKEAAEKAERLAARTEKVAQYTDPSLYNLNDMSDEKFDELMVSLKKQDDERIAAEKAEAERIAKEEADRKAEQERIIAENAKLRAEAEAKVKAEAAAEAKREAERKKEVERQAAIEAKHQAEIAAERAKVAAIEAEQRKKAEAEARAKEEAEAAEKARIEAEKKAEMDSLLAPDKDKILNFGRALEMIRTEKLPAVKTKQAQDIINELDKKFIEMQSFINEKVKQL